MAPPGCLRPGGRRSHQSSSWDSASSAAWTRAANNSLGGWRRRGGVRPRLAQACRTFHWKSSEGLGWRGSQKTQSGRPTATTKSPSGLKRPAHQARAARKAARRALAPRMGGVWAALIQARLSWAGPPRRHHATLVACAKRFARCRPPAAAAGATSRRNTHPAQRKAAPPTVRLLLARSPRAGARRAQSRAPKQRERRLAWTRDQNVATRHHRTSVRKKNT